jgi:ABC-2 type transport system permease protein
MSEFSFRCSPPAAPARVADLKAVWYREYALLARNRVNLVLGLTPMVVYLLLVNTSLGNVVGHIEYRGQDLRYSVFLLPMVLAMAVVGASGTTGMALFQEEMTGAATLVWSYPVRRSRFLLGKVAAGTSLVLAQSLVALIVGSVVFDYGLAPQRWAALLVTLILASVAFNGLYLAAAVAISDYRAFMLVTSLSVTVLVFAAPSFSTAQQMPLVLRWISYVNPVTYAVDGLRDAAVLGFGGAWPSLLVLLGIALVGNTVTGRVLTRRIRNL